MMKTPWMFLFPQNSKRFEEYDNSKEEPIVRKLFSVLMLVLLLVLVTGCDNGDPDDDPEIVTITYAGWNLGNIEDYNLERRMIDAFMDQYPNIKVDIVERPKVADPANPDVELDMNWDEMLAAMAATGDLPDLYMYATVPTAVINGWAHDMTEVMQNDPELAKVPQDIATGAVYNGKYFGIPQSNFYFGYFINRTLFERANLEAPEFGVTWDELLEAAQDVATTPDDGTGIVGFSGVDRIFEWMPAQYDGSLGWYTYNEEGFHLDSPAFASAMELMRGFYDKNMGQYAEYVFETSSVSKKTKWYAEGSGTQFQKGRHAIMWDATWSWGWMLPNLIDEEQGLYQMDLDFIGTPVIVDGVQRIPVVLDYLVAGQGTEHPEEAYLLAKWLGFGKDGYLKRLEIAQEFPAAGSVNFAPLQQDETLFDAYLALFPAGTMSEYRKVLEHDSFIIEGVKTVPGYSAARWNYQYGTYGEDSYTIATMLDAIRSGQVNLADVAVQLNARVNQAHDEAWVALNNAIND